MSFRVPTSFAWLSPFLALALTTDAAAQCEFKKLAQTGAADDRFGAAVAASFGVPTLVVVGAPEVGTAAGEVSIYSAGGSSLTLLDTLQDGTSNNNFGSSVGASGDRVIVGAPFDGPIFQNIGTAYIYERDVTNNFNLVRELDPIGSTIAFGNAVSISSTTAVATQGGIAERLHIFERGSGNWDEIAAFNGPGGSLYGESVSISALWIVVGAPLQTQGALGQIGAAYVYELDTSTGTWGQVAQLQHPFPGQGDLFGWSVAAFGPTVAVSAPQDDLAGTDSGTVFVFGRDEGGPGNWGLRRTLTAGGNNSRTGWSISMSSDWIVAGSPNATGTGGVATGAAYVFNRGEGGFDNWGLAYEALPSDGMYPDEFGEAVAALPGGAYIGAPGDDNSNGVDAGSLYTYIHDGCITISTFCYCPFGQSGACPNADENGGCANVTGQGATLSYSGTSSVAADDLRFDITNMPPNALQIVFMGDASTGVLLGNGFRCVGGSALIRFPAMMASSSGTGQLGPGIVAQSQSIPGGAISAGQTWYFQDWYRDNGGPCGDVTNLSNAARVDFGL